MITSSQNWVPSKFEIFDDRIEITSAGSLPEGLSKDDFFEGVPFQ
ncbi:hypothetical protein [Flagellimonas abyssi]|nr:hypothetical protein [Allomuricauda abyssi]